MMNILINIYQIIIVSFYSFFMIQNKSSLIFYKIFEINMFHITFLNQIFGSIKFQILIIERNIAQTSCNQKYFATGFTDPFHFSEYSAHIIAALQVERINNTVELIIIERQLVAVCLNQFEICFPFNLFIKVLMSLQGKSILSFQFIYFLKCLSQHLGAPVNTYIASNIIWIVR